MSCTSTLTTLTVTVTRRGDRLLRADVTLVTCNRKRPHHETLGHGPQHWHKPTGEEPYFAEWSDDTPGATPHRDPDPCPDCGGTGVDETSWVPATPLTPDEVDPCPSCGGSGTAPTDGCDGTDCRIPAAHTDPDPMDELVAVSEQAGLYDDSCPDCERGKVRRGFFDVPCPSCGGSGTAPTVTDAKTCPICDQRMTAFMTMGPGRNALCLKCANDVAAARAREENRDG